LRWLSVVRGSTTSSQTCKRRMQRLSNAAAVNGGGASLEMPLPLTKADGWKAQ
jgi:hypothetical protein